MIEIPLIDELREVRRRLSESCGNDVARYAEMLREVATRVPGRYVTRPLIPSGTAPSRQADTSTESPSSSGALTPSRAI
jgi:hypothetical protein